MPKRIRDLIGIQAGDRVAIVGPKQTIVRIAVLSTREEVNEDIVGLDERDRQLLGVRVGAKVQVQKPTEKDEEELLEVERNIWLFCYGSNNPERLGQRLGRTIEGVAAYLPGYQRVFRGYSRTWESGVASLEAKRGAATYGYATQVTAEELEKLDIFEGTAIGAYRRQQFQIRLQEDDDRERRVRAYAYVSLSDTYNEPSQEYLEAIVKTINSFWTEDGEEITTDDIPKRNPFHRSQNYFDSFDTSKARFGDYGPGIYFADDHESVRTYGPYLYDATLKLDNPLNVEEDNPQVVAALERQLQLVGAILEDEGPPLIQLMGMAQSMWENLQDPVYSPSRVIKVLQKLGYDGIIVPSKGFSVVFDPKQITSFKKLGTK